MIISKLLNEILIIMLLILVPVSCVNKNKQNETHLIAVTYRGYEDKTYYLIKGDTVSSICFSTFKYSNGTYDIIGDGIDSIYCKRKIPELKNKTFKIPIYTKAAIKEYINFAIYLIIYALVILLFPASRLRIENIIKNK